MMPPVVRFLFFVFLAIPLGKAMALEIRTYNPNRHDRFVSGVSGLEINPGAYYDASLYTAVAFATNTNDNRQFALVTPEHVLFARHFASGGNIRFINSENTAINRVLGAKTDVPNGSGGISDVCIMKLSAPLTETDRIVPLPYLNLASENSFRNKVLITFGQIRRAGRGVIQQITTPSVGGIDPTRSLVFNYNKASGNQDDAYATTGDSGSPSFVIAANNRPALVGVHLAVGEDSSTNSNFDTLVPHYAGTINGLLAADGYQLIPANPESVTLNASEVHDTLRQKFPGTVNISLANTSAATATNVRLKLTFPAAAIPDSISAPGWIVETVSPGQYKLRTATTSGNTSANLTASYTSLPIVTSISINAIHRSDGSAEQNVNLDLPVLPTFAAYVAGLSLKGKSDDPDTDGFPNLIEYAFGGEPGTASAFATAGHSLTPDTFLENGNITYTFPRRTDAAARNMGYEIEFSESLEANSWITTPPPGFDLTTAPYDPVTPGFEKVTATFPAALVKIFMHVKVVLTE